MKAKLIGVVVAGIVLLLSSFRFKHDLKPARILQQMNDSIKNIHTLRTNIYALERVEDKYLVVSSFIKLNVNPRKLYFKNPQKKLEILYYEGKMNNKALVKSNVFPYVSILLDPTSNIMRKNQHYTIHELGFDFVGKSIAFTISKDKDGLANFKYQGRVLKNNRYCHYIEYENKNFTYVDYKVGLKETVASIAMKEVINDYLIRYKNDLLNEYGYLKPGSVLKVPTLFCKKAALYIDEKLMLPVSVSLFDESGVFENYEFSNIEVNKAIQEEEFSRNYVDYKF
jgi:hypothetical protein